MVLSFHSLLPLLLTHQHHPILLSPVWFFPSIVSFLSSLHINIIQLPMSGVFLLFLRLLCLFLLHQHHPVTYVRCLPSLPSSPLSLPSTSTSSSFPMSCVFLPFLRLLCLLLHQYHPILLCPVFFSPFLRLLRLLLTQHHPNLLCPVSFFSSFVSFYINIIQFPRVLCRSSLPSSHSSPSTSTSSNSPVSCVVLLFLRLFRLLLHQHHPILLCPVSFFHSFVSFVSFYINTIQFSCARCLSSLPSSPSSLPSTSTSSNSPVSCVVLLFLRHLRLLLHQHHPIFLFPVSFFHSFVSFYINIIQFSCILCFSSLSASPSSPSFTSTPSNSPVSCVFFPSFVSFYINIIPFSCVLCLLSFLRILLHQHHPVLLCPVSFFQSFVSFVSFYFNTIQFACVFLLFLRLLPFLHLHHHHPIVLCFSSLASFPSSPSTSTPSNSPVSCVFLPLLRFLLHQHHPIVPCPVSFFPSFVSFLSSIYINIIQLSRVP